MTSVALSLIWLKIDGQEEKKLTFIELCPHLEWYLILTEANLTGQNLELWLGCIRKLMIVWRSICMHSCLCVGGFVVFLPKKVGIKLLFFLVLVKEAKIPKILKFPTFFMSILSNSTHQLFFKIVNYAQRFPLFVNSAIKIRSKENKVAPWVLRNSQCLFNIRLMIGGR